MASEIRADMAANVFRLLVEDASEIEVGQTILVLESMKMEIPVTAPTAGKCYLHVQEAQAVEEGDLLATIGGDG